MPDLPLFELDAESRWRLAYDQHQWIVQRRDGRRTWRGIAFIGSEKSTLWRIFREKQIWLRDEAIARVDALPDYFCSFLRQHDPELAKRHPIYLAHRGAKKAHTARSRSLEQSPTRDPKIASDERATPPEDASESGGSTSRVLVRDSDSDHSTEMADVSEEGVDRGRTS